MKNRDIGLIFAHLADLLELKGESPFKVRAYRKVAWVIGDVPDDMSHLVAQDRLREIPGVGEAIAKKISEIVTTGKLGLYERLKGEFPDGLVDLIDIPGIGPKHALLLATELGVRNAEQLETAIASGQVARLPGMGKKSADNIMRAIRVKRGEQPGVAC